MDKYRIDSHKLIYHVPRVKDWLSGKTIYPIYMEISPSGACNHRCTYCALDFMEYKKRYLDTGLLKDRLTEMGNLGLKSVMYAGEGEPFLHKDMANIVKHTKKSGIDVAITTNGVLLKKELAEKILGDVEWIKVSINGATRDTYAKIHRSRETDLDRVIDNMSYAVKIRTENGYKCTLGMQILLIPENRDEVKLLAELARDIGMDYLVVKPYSQHPLSKTNIYADISYSDCLNLADELMNYNNKDFSVVFRVNAMKEWDDAERSYKCCLALPFWSYMDAGGNIWGCSIFLGDDRFSYGNIYDNSFQEIWEGEKRSNSLEWVESKLDVSKCRVNCRMHQVNRYLWNLKNPLEHMNFI